MRPIWAICMKSGQKCSRIGQKNSIIYWCTLYTGEPWSSHAPVVLFMSAKELEKRKWGITVKKLWIAKLLHNHNCINLERNNVMFHFWASWGSSSFQISKCNQEAANLVLNTKRQHWICIGVLKTMSTSLVIFSNLALIFCWQGSHSQVEYPSQG